MIYGWAYGLWLAFFLFRYVRPHLQKHVRQILKTQQICNEDYLVSEGRNHVQPKNINKTICFLKGMLLWVLIVALSFINILYLRETFVYKEEWIDRIIEKCDPDKKELNLTSIFADSAVIKTGLVSTIFGGYFGILYDAAYLGGTRPNINDTPIIQGIARLFIAALILAPLLLPYFLLNSNLGTISLFFLRTTLPFFILSFLLFSYMKVIYKKLGIINTNVY